MKKIAFILFFALIISLTAGAGLVSADFGSGAALMCQETRVIKSALYGKKISFSDLDIKQALCINDFDKITITQIPKSSEGALMLGGRRIGNGTEIKRKNLPSLVFIPAESTVSEAKFYFTVDDFLSGSEIEFLIRFTDKINYEPKISEDKKASLEIDTQREIGVYSKMQASDAENDMLEYMVIGFPKYGTIEILDKNSGEYLYTPPYSFVGNDSFTYVCRDEWGNFSEPYTVNIKIDERMSEVVYFDMQNRAEYNSAVAMSAMGVMAGELIGDNVYFNPDKSLTRAEFVAMAMKTMGRSCDTRLSSSFFDDNAEIPAPLLSYVATAQREGIIQGSFSDGRLLFKPNEPITKYEAGLIMSRLIDKDYEGEVPVFSDKDTIPSYARDAVYTMFSLGIFESDDGKINPTDTVSRAECAEYLYRLYKTK
jgi:hypothetical protein